ncbi:MAG: UvrD-helicase domain-containing protein [Clostridia bacterium]|nr:UvrD-helicase domain-containing protein [Clostridia bacterium]
MAFTPAQQDAMTARDRTLLISAAAGSGKTYTLTHRIIDSIIADESKSLDRMLIVTFTRAAAGELKAKISKALSEAIAADPGNMRLQAQLMKLGNAHISTIDSFFSGPIRANFEKLGLPASMRMADEAELAPVRDNVLKGTLDLFFDNHSGIEDGVLTDVGHRSAYTDLLSLISGARDSSSLLPSLTKIYRKLTTSPRGIKRLYDHAARMEEAAGADFFEGAEGKVILGAVSDTVNYARLRLEKCIGEMQAEIALLSDDSSPEAIGAGAGLQKKYIPDFEDDVNRLISLSEALKRGYGAAREAFDALKFKTISRLTADEKSELAEHFKTLRGKILDPVKKLGGVYFKHSTEEIGRQYLVSAELCRVLGQLLEEFDHRYSEEKLRRGVCEFSDMPKFMLRLLQNEDGTPTAFADSMAKDFDEVYIDEYQDVNEIQDRIFELIGRDRRFMVGDIKQSIYGFREAEPSIFAAYRRRFPLYDREHPEIRSEDGGNSIFMSNNFRCDENVVKFSNQVCSTVFSAFADSIGYTSKDDLIFSKDNKIPDYKSPHVVLNLIQPKEDDSVDEEETLTLTEDKNEDRYYDEAVVTANEIARLIRDGNEHTAAGKRITAGDIAVLVRGHALAKPLTDALSRLGIKYVTSTKTELFEGYEMKLLVDLLTVIDNPRSDVPLCRLLCAEGPAITPWMNLDRVIRIRKRAEGSRSLFDALILFGETDEDADLAKVCRDFVAWIEKMRHLSSKLSADKLLRALSQGERYAALCESEAYTYLYNCACRYVRQSWNGLYSFLTYFKNLLEKGEAGSEPIKAQGDEVRIMTIHQSKGLEFNVCFLFGLGKGFNVLDTRDALIFSRDFGLSLKLPPYFEGKESPFERVRRRKEDTAMMRAAALKIKNDLIEEEARIFYVALTRACERLYLSGTLKKPYAQVEREYLDCPDVSYSVKNGSNYLHWTLLPLAGSGRETDVYKINLFERGESRLASPVMRTEVEAAEQEFSEDDRLLAEELNRPHGESEEEKLLSTIPAKVAASKVSSTMLDNSIFSPIPTGKLFGEEGDEIEESENETATHIKNRILLMRSRTGDFDSLLEVNKKPTAAEKGTAAHLFLQYCDYERTLTHGLEEEIARLCEQRYISRRTADIIDRRQLAPFFKSELFDHIRKAKQVRREFQFGMFHSASDFTEDSRLKELVADKKIFVQGSVDLLIETEDGEILLCDYKTDRISAEERSDPALLTARMQEKHGEQLKQYRFAVKEIFGREPTRVYIYSVPLGRLIEIEES